ncbi:hypothetical protein GCM10028821_22360 [Hymenobacter jeollabukensis]
MKQHLRLLLPLALLIGAGYQAQSQGVGIGTTSPDGAAVLDVNSTNRGFLPARMTQAQRGLIPVTSQSAGLLVYQTDGTAGYYYYTGAGWLPLGAQGPQGPVGATSPQGATGPSGPAGPYWAVGCAGPVRRRVGRGLVGGERTDGRPEHDGRGKLAARPGQSAVHQPHH